MTKINKLFIGLSLVLALIIIIEIGYFFFSSKKTLPASNQTSSSSLSPKPASLTTNNLSPTIIPSPSIPLSKEKLIAQLITDSLIDYAKALSPFIEEKSLQSFVITVNIEGIITRVDKTPKTIKNASDIEPTDIAASITITTKREGKTEEIEYGFSATEVVILNIWEVDKDGNEKPIDFDQLKPGDKISLNLTSDLLRHPNNNLIGGRIIKYSAL